MNQHARIETLRMFKDGEIAYLIASDVAARGLDIPDVSHVFNFDIPDAPEDYVHRTGRTGRAGKVGHALSLVTPSDFGRIASIEKLIGLTLPWLGGEPSAQDREGGDRRRGRGRGRKVESRGREPARAARALPEERAAKSQDKPSDTQEKPTDERDAGGAGARGRSGERQTEDAPRRSRPARSRKPRDDEGGRTAAPEPRKKSRRNDGGDGETGWQEDQVPAFLQRSVRT
jgi:superfamily II DNA/RNA helicase